MRASHLEEKENAMLFEMILDADKDKHRALCLSQPVCLSQPFEEINTLTFSIIARLDK